MPPPRRTLARGYDPGDADRAHARPAPLRHAGDRLAAAAGGAARAGLTPGRALPGGPPAGTGRAGAPGDPAPGARRPGRGQRRGVAPHALRARVPRAHRRLRALPHVPPPGRRRARPTSACGACRPASRCSPRRPASWQRSTDAPLQVRAAEPVPDRRALLARGPQRRGLPERAPFHGPPGRDPAARGRGAGRGRHRRRAARRPGADLLLRPGPDLRRALARRAPGAHLGCRARAAGGDRGHQPRRRRPQGRGPPALLPQRLQAPAAT